MRPLRLLAMTINTGACMSTRMLSTRPTVAQVAEALNAGRTTSRALVEEALGTTHPSCTSPGSALLTRRVE